MKLFIASGLLMYDLTTNPKTAKTEWLGKMIL